MAASAPTSLPRAARRLAVWLGFPAAAAVFAAGVWVAGGVITSSFRVSMALVALWFVLAAGGVALIARRRRRLAAPVVSGFVVAAVAAETSSTTSPGASTRAGIPW